MAMPAYDDEDLTFVEATVNYVVDNGIRPVTYIAEMGESNRRDETPDHRKVPIYDGRPVADQLTLDQNGFTFQREETGVTDFLDNAQIENIYNPEVEKIVAAATGASRVLVFDHTLRVADDETRTSKKLREPVHVVHNDYTDLSAPQRIRDLLPADEAEAALKAILVASAVLPMAGRAARISRSDFCKPPNSRSISVKPLVIPVSLPSR